MLKKVLFEIELIIIHNRLPKFQLDFLESVLEFRKISANGINFSEELLLANRTNIVIFLSKIEIQNCVLTMSSHLLFLF